MERKKAVAVAIEKIYDAFDKVTALYYSGKLRKQMEKISFISPNHGEPTGAIWLHF